MRERGIAGRLLPVVALLSALPAAGLELDLEGAVSLALEQNPALRAVEERRGEVKAGIREALGEAFPELALFSSWSRSRNPSLLNSPDFEAFLENFPDGDFVPREQELYRLALELRQPLFTWGKIPAGIRLAQVISEVAEAQIETARLDTAAAAAEAYFGLLAAQASLATVEIQERVRAEALAVVEARFEIGEATRLELLRAQAAVAELRPEVDRIRGRVAVAEQELRVVLGQGRETAIVARETRSEPLPSPSLDRLLGAALAGRPELADLDLQAEALGLQQKVTTAEGRPQVELTGSYGREVRLPDNLSDSLYQDWAVILGLRWEFFDGGKRRGAVAQLESQRRQVGWRLQDLVNRVTLEIERARTEYETARERWRSAEESARAASEASRVAGESYELGVALQADLLDAQQREILAELTRIEAYYDARIGAARLERAVGRTPSAGPFADAEAEENEE